MEIHQNVVDLIAWLNYFYESVNQPLLLYSSTIMLKLPPWQIVTDNHQKPYYSVIKVLYWYPVIIPGADLRNKTSFNQFY